MIANRSFLEAYQLSFLTSTALAALMGPKAYRTRATTPMAMTAIGAIGMLDMGYRWYLNRGLAA